MLPSAVSDEAVSPRLISYRASVAMVSPQGTVQRPVHTASTSSLVTRSAASVATINAILEVRLADMTITTHVCRGNFRSTWFSSGGYDPVAEVLLGGVNYDAFFLEYDTDRAGDFAPLSWRHQQFGSVLFQTRRDC